MANGYDGSIRMKTEIETKNVSSQMLKLTNSITKAEEEIKRLRNRMKELEDAKIPTQEYEKLKKELISTNLEFEKLNEKKKLLESKKIPTQQYESLSKELKEAENNYEKLSEQASMFMSIGAPLPDTFVEKLDKASLKISELEDAIKDLNATGKAFTNEFELDSVSTEKLKSRLSETTQNVTRLKSELSRMESSGTAFISGAGTEEYARAAAKVKELAGDIEESKLRMAELHAKQEPVATGFSRIKDTASKAFSVLNTLSGKVFGRLKNTAKKAFSSIQRDTKKTSGFFSTFASRLKGISMSLLIFNWITKAFNAMVSGMKSGFENLSGHSREYAQSVQNLKNAMSTLGNSFAAAFSPIVQAAIPYLIKLINWVNTAVNAIAQLIAYLSGKSTWTKAKQVQDGYNDSLKETAAAAKKAYGSLAQFDDLEVWQAPEEESGNGGSSGSAGGGFEEVPIDEDIKSFAEKIKEILSQIFAPLKEAWNREGEFVMSAWKYALDEVWNLVKDIGRDFLEVWNQEKTIKIFENILHIVGDIGLVIGNIASAFDEAWNENKTGLHILENIRDIFAVIVANVREAADATVEWCKKLDFSPLLESISGLTESLIPVAESLSGILSDFYTEVLLTLGQWVLEKGLPDLLDVFTGFIEKVDWEKLRENLSDFWEHLEPFAETVGEGLILFIQELSDVVANFLNSDNLENFLDSLSEWMDNVEPEDVADGIESLAKALLSLKAAVVILGGALTASKIVITFSKAAQAIGKLKEALSGSMLIGFFKKIGEVIALTAGGAGTLSESFAAVFGTVGSVIGSVVSIVGGAIMAITNFVSMLKDGFSWIKEIMMLIGIALTAIGSVIAGVAAAPATIVAAVVAAVTTLVVVIKEHWEEIKAFFEKIPGWFMELWGKVKEFAVEKWNEFTAWWNSSALVSWWNNDVKPWFTEEKWAVLLQSVKTAFTQKWDEIKTAVSEKLGSLKQAAGEKIDAMKEKATSLIDKFVEFKDSASESFKVVKEKIKDALDPTIERLKKFVDLIKDAISGIKDFLKSGYEKISGIGDSIGSFVGGLIPGSSSASISSNAAAMSSSSYLKSMNPTYVASSIQRASVSSSAFSVDAIKQGFREAMSEYGGGGEYTFVAQLDGRTIFEETVSRDKIFRNSTGRSAFSV